MTAPFFIVSSGRSGTAMLHKALSAKPDIEMHHEFDVAATQKLAVQRYLGLVTADETRAALEKSFGAAIAASRARLWGDSSNKLSWLIDDLAALFGGARFVHLVRDGRKVTSSYFHKLGAECYPDAAHAAMQAHYDGAAPPPPAEKPYWWPVPRREDPLAAPFRAFDQFQRIAWHWAEINRVILAALAKLAPERTLFVKLEDLSQDPQSLRRLYDFLGLSCGAEDIALFQRPHNVNRPEDRLLTEPQRRQFAAVAGPMLERLGYAGQPEYAVAY